MELEFPDDLDPCMYNMYLYEQFFDYCLDDSVIDSVIVDEIFGHTLSVRIEGAPNPEDYMDVTTYESIQTVYYAFTTYKSFFSETEEN